jgi:hypothetical protein
MGRRETAERQGRIELELMEERAGALRRISQTLESLIEELGQLRARLGAPAEPRRSLGGGGSNPSADVAHYRELRRRAVRYRWYLEVQRESLGLHPDHRLDEFYSIPAPL